MILIWTWSNSSRKAASILRTWCWYAHTETHCIAQCYKVTETHSKNWTYFCFISMFYFIYLCPSNSPRRSTWGDKIYCTFFNSMEAVGIVTCCGLDGLGIESHWGQYFLHPADRPLGPPSLLYNGYRVFPRVKQPGPSVDHPSTSSTEVKEWVKLYLYSPHVPSWPVVGWPLPSPVWRQLLSLFINRALHTDNQSPRSFVIPFIESVDAALYVPVSR
jgi:hypothetical protein